MVTAGAPVVFVHGMFLHAASWGAGLELVRAVGYVPVAPGWPGEASTVSEARDGPDQVVGNGIDDIVAHYAQIIDSLEVRPIVVGHSTGGLIALRSDRAWPVRRWQSGRQRSRACSTWRRQTARVGWVALRNSTNRRRALSLTPRQFRYALGNALSTATHCSSR